jgi:hypothetical protein
MVAWLSWFWVQTATGRAISRPSRPHRHELRRWQQDLMDRSRARARTIASFAPDRSVGVGV